MKAIWFAVDCNIYTNPKVLALSVALSVDVDTLVGKLGRLWSWAMLSGNETGEMPHLPEQEIADIMRWKKPAKKLVAAMLQCGLIDKKEQTLYIHDWTELNGGFAEKKRKERDRKSDGKSVEFPRKKSGNSTDTVPNPTVPISGGGGGGFSFLAREAKDYLAERGLDISALFGFDEAAWETAAATAGQLFSHFSMHEPTQQDIIEVFLATYRQEGESPECSIVFPKKRVDLLFYAFEQAVRSGKAGNWNYICGVLRKLYARGIETLDAAQDYDDRRNDSGN